MSVTSRILLLVCGLVVTLPGCSRSRLRQIFTPEREFMSMSELEEYDRTRTEDVVEDSDRPGLFASLTGRSDDSESTGEERPGVFSGVTRLLSWNQDDAASDPFLETDNEPADGDSQSTPVLTAGLEREATEDAVVGSDMTQEDDAQPSPETDAEVTFGFQDDMETQSTGQSFADIMAQFEDDEDLDDPFAAEEEEEQATLDNFDALLADAEADNGRHDDGQEFQLNPEMLTEEIRASSAYESDDVPELSMTDDFAPVSDVEAEDPFAAMLKDEVVSSASDSDPAVPLLSSPSDAARVLDDSMWQAFDRPAADRPSGGSSSTDPFAAPVDWTMTQAEPAATGSPVLPPADNFGEVASPEIHVSGPLVLLPNATSQSATEELPTAVTSREPAPATEAPSDSSPWEQDALWNDFETQAAAVTTPASEPTPAAVPGLLSRLSSRSWLLILGAIVILYLLFAPERKNLPSPGNR